MSTKRYLTHKIKIHTERGEETITGLNIATLEYDENGKVASYAITPYIEEIPFTEHYDGTLEIYYI